MLGVAAQPMDNLGNKEEETSSKIPVRSEVSQDSVMNRAATMLHYTKTERRRSRQGVQRSNQATT